MLAALFASLVPDCHLEPIPQESGDLLFALRSTTSTSCCPLCQQPSRRVHSQYVRYVADLAWATQPVRLRLHIRRFRCSTPTCTRRIFAERWPSLLATFARRTARLDTALTHLALAAGGEAGVRLGAHLGLYTSADTLLRLIRRTPNPPARLVRRIGIDEWAWRKQRQYGVIIIDLDTHEVLDLLRDDARATVVAWLQQHPELELISRDRSGPFAAAATEGAPQAQQVADRFHLVVRRITRYSIPVPDGKGSKGSLWVNDLPGGESQRGQSHVA
jgi:transposase